MQTELAFGRAHSDLEVMSRAGLPLHRFMDESATALRGAVPFVAGCFATIDPETTLVSGAYKVGALVGRDEADVQWAHVEYGGDEPTSFTAMLASGRASLGIVQDTRGDIARSQRMNELMVPTFDFHDEARVVFTERGLAWGSLALFRGSDDPAFTDAELALLAELGPAFARGLRTGMLARPDDPTGPGAPAGPAVFVVDAADRIVSASPGAEAQLARLAAVPGASEPRYLVHGLVTGARRFARGEDERMPRVRARTADGAWLVLHAAPLGGTADRAGDVVVTLEEARPQEVVRLVGAAFGLTARERDVVALVLRGVDTREIALALHLSAYTVQDHLKSVFEKAGVRSRRELVSRVYFEQFAPR